MDLKYMMDYTKMQCDDGLESEWLKTLMSLIMKILKIFVSYGNHFDNI
jgi:hypothetical protein